MKTKLVSLFYAPSTPVGKWTPITDRYIRRGKYLIHCEWGSGLLHAPCKIFGHFYKMVNGKPVLIADNGNVHRRDVEMLIINKEDNHGL